MSIHKTYSSMMLRNKLMELMANPNIVVTKITPTIVVNGQIVAANINTKPLSKTVKDENNEDNIQLVEQENIHDYQ